MRSTPDTMPLPDTHIGEPLQGRCHVLAASGTARCNVSPAQPGANAVTNWSWNATDFGSAYCDADQGLTKARIWRLQSARWTRPALPPGKFVRAPQSERILDRQIIVHEFNILAIPAVLA